MTRTLSTLLILTLLPGSLIATAQPDDTSWSGVKTMKVGAPLYVTFAGDRTSRQVYFVAADNETVTLLDPIGASLSPKATRFSVELLRESPGSLAQVGGEYVSGDFRFTSDGLYYRGDRIAARADVLRTVQRTEIIQVWFSSHNGGGLPGWVKPTLLAAAVVLVLSALATHGAIPLCFFARCD